MGRSFTRGCEETGLLTWPGLTHYERRGHVMCLLMALRRERAGIRAGLLAPIHRKSKHGHEHHANPPVPYAVRFRGGDRCNWEVNP